ncbi:unnamed protein product [Acanthocheilonema viteae]|uniref:Uncharacterized protein n=1 Tax=Acanthocheilonema viteae TaxID=6277 RepID=A0A498S749_ACAVI|nr:unnamed protein product [Acanthocheilonema viteae]
MRIRKINKSDPVGLSANNVRWPYSDHTESLGDGGIKNLQWTERNNIKTVQRMSDATCADSAPELPLVRRLEILRAVDSLESDAGEYE